MNNNNKPEDIKGNIMNTTKNQHYKLRNQTETLHYTLHTKFLPGTVGRGKFTIGNLQSTSKSFRDRDLNN